VLIGFFFSERETDSERYSDVAKIRQGQAKETSSFVLPALS
jgi:hypothetical protein